MSTVPDIAALFDAVDMGFFEVERDGTIVRMNDNSFRNAAPEVDGAADQFTKIDSLRVGWTAVDEAGVPIEPDDMPTRVALRDGVAVRRVVGNRRSSGDITWLEVTAWPSLVDDEGVVQRVTATTRPADARMLAEQVAAERGALLSAIIEREEDFVVVSQADGQVRFVSPSVTERLGWTAADLTADRGFTSTHPDDIAQLRASYASLLDGSRRSFHTTHRSRTRDGRWTWVEGTVTSYLGEPPIDAIVSHVRDVTELHAARSERDHLGRRMEAMFETIDDLLFEIDVQADGTASVEYISPNYWRVSGRDPGDLAQFTGWGDTVIADDQAEYARFHADLEADGAATALLRSRDPRRAERDLTWAHVRGICERRPDGSRGLLYLVTDVTEQYEREDELVRLSRLFEAAVANMQAELLIADDDGRVLLANERLLANIAAFGGGALEPGDDMRITSGAWAARMVDPEGGMARIEQLMASREPVLGDRVRMRDGTVFERDVVPIAVDGDVVWRLWVTREITATIRAAEQLERARRSAEDSSRQKTRFLATMSHEIRTPLNGVIGMLELLADEPHAGRARAMLSTVRGSADALLAIINDVLEISQIEEGRVEIAHAPLDVREVAREVCELFAPLAQRNDVELRTEVADDVPQALLGDGARTRQVLVNLVDNAVRHTPSGHIDIRVGVVEVADAGANANANADAAARPGELRVRFAVHDTGTGVSPEVRGRLFDPLPSGGFQSEPAPASDRPATGLGLSICSRLVGLLGGEIRCRSTVGVGSTFEFDLPLQVGAGQPVVPPGARVAEADLPPEAAAPGTRRVLVVEDNAVNREVLLRQLERLGCGCVAVDNGDDALAALAEGGYDGVLMDCQMRGLDGYDTTRRIRALGMQAVSGGTIPVIAVTASAFTEDRARCLAAGMDEVLAKPVRIDALREVLERRVRRSAHDGSDPVPRGSVVTGAPDGDRGDEQHRYDRARHEPPVLDRTQVDELRDDLADDTILVRSLGIYLDELPVRLRALASADTAGDVDAFARAAHELKSTSSTFGAAALAEACSRIEAAARRGDVDGARVAARTVPPLADGARARLELIVRELDT